MGYIHTAEHDTTCTKNEVALTLAVDGARCSMDTDMDMDTISTQ